MKFRKIDGKFQTITDDIDDFFENGGWDFLNNESDQEEQVSNIFSD